MGIAASTSTLFYIKKIGRKPLFFFGMIGSIITNIILCALGWSGYYEAHKYLLIINMMFFGTTVAPVTMM